MTTPKAVLRMICNTSGRYIGETFGFLHEMIQERFGIPRFHAYLTYRTITAHIT